MKVNVEKENKMLRIVIDFLNYEKPNVAYVLRRLFADYRRSFENVCFERDTTEKNLWFTEFYIRAEDLRRLNWLLEEAG